MDINKIHKYKGYLIQNMLYHGEPKWFVLRGDMTKLKAIPERTIKQCKEYIDFYVENIQGIDRP